MKGLKIKNLFFSILFCFSFLLSSFGYSLHLKAKASKYTTYTYAQISGEDTYLYKSINSTQITNAYFLLPKTYFVLLLSNIAEDFYKVMYSDVVGYVLKNQVLPVNETPSTPYLQNITFRVYSSDGTNVFSTPFNTKNSTVVETVEVLSPLTYYGEILGDEFILNRGYSWVYCKTKSGNFGYVYKGLCDNFTPFTENSEKVTFKKNVFFEEDDNGYLYNLVNLTPGLKFLLIVLIILPSLGLIYLLFKPFKIEKSLNKKNKNYSCNNNAKSNNHLHTHKTHHQHQQNFFEKLKNLKGKIFKNNKTTSTQKSCNNKNTNTTTKKNIVKTKLNKTKNYKNKNIKNKGNNYKNKTLNTIQKIIDDDLL